jgi:hypothetical protein
MSGSVNLDPKKSYLFLLDTPLGSHARGEVHLPRLDRPTISLKLVDGIARRGANELTRKQSTVAGYMGPHGQAAGCAIRERVSWR